MPVAPPLSELLLMIASEPAGTSNTSTAFLVEPVRLTELPAMSTTEPELWLTATPPRTVSIELPVKTTLWAFKAYTP